MIMDWLTKINEGAAESTYLQADLGLHSPKKKKKKPWS